MLIDANLLIYAADATSPFHRRTRAWLTDQLNGVRRVGMPWESLTAFLRLTTNARVLPRPLAVEQAWSLVQDWLDSPLVWVPMPTPTHGSVLRDLLVGHHVRAGLVHDAHLAALALQHGLTICSADTDFARFTEISWHNPLASRE